MDLPVSFMTPYGKQLFIDQCELDLRLVHNLLACGASTRYRLYFLHVAIASTIPGLLP